MLYKAVKCVRSLSFVVLSHVASRCNVLRRIALCCVVWLHVLSCSVSLRRIVACCVVL